MKTWIQSGDVSDGHLELFSKDIFETFPSLQYFCTKGCIKSVQIGVQLKGCYVHTHTQIRV